ncbi:MAG: hypothetical protein KDD44_12285 [Bdellovibrionales bacterium]|nr:hypothetical protein [Bdellovibrionales bacterium]
MDQSVANRQSRRRVWTSEEIRSKVESSKVVLFTKGTKEQPRCGFSERAFVELEPWSSEVEVINVCEDSSIIPALRSVVGRKALPLVSVDGTFHSCSDDLPKMLESGELRHQVEKVFSKN